MTVCRICLNSCIEMSNVLTLYLQLSLYFWTLAALVMASACRQHQLLVCQHCEGCSAAVSPCHICNLKLNTANFHNVNTIGEASDNLHINSYLCPSSPFNIGLLPGERR